MINFEDTIQGNWDSSKYRKMLERRRNILLPSLTRYESVIGLID